MPIECILSTEKRELLLLSKDKWSVSHKFKVHGRSESDYAMNPLITEVFLVEEYS
jgi:hypothetical protein